MNDGFVVGPKENMTLAPVMAPNMSSDDNWKQPKTDPMPGRQELMSPLKIQVKVSNEGDIMQKVKHTA